MATPVFFRSTGEYTYVYDDYGLLAGTAWSDMSGNMYWGVIFLHDLSEVKYEKSIQFMYDVQIQPIGFSETIQYKRKTLVLSNDVLVDYVPATANLSRLFGKQEPREEPPGPNAIGQLDLFMGLYYKGTIQPPPTGLPPIYEWLLDLILAAETAQA